MALSRTSTGTLMGVKPCSKTMKSWAMRSTASKGMRRASPMSSFNENVSSMEMPFGRFERKPFMATGLSSLLFTRSNMARRNDVWRSIRPKSLVPS